MNRRDFIKNTTFASTALLIPGFLTAQLRFPNKKDKRLIILQLSGGNDGLNTIVPFKNDLYYKYRPMIALQKQELNVVTDEVGFHPSLKQMAKLFENGDLTIINGVAYPNPNRSHFRSMDIWHSASDSHQNWQTGWLGRYLDQQGNNNLYPTAIEIDGSLSMALKGNEQKALALQNIKQFNQISKSRLNKILAQQHDFEHQNHAYLYKTITQTVNASNYIEEKLGQNKPLSNFPNTILGKQLKSIAEMVVNGMETPIYYASVSGFDTHANQLNTQQRLLNNLDEALGSLVSTLQTQNLWDNTLVMVFSEFGRRVAENGSRGTDHGSGNQVFLLSGGLKKPGFFNPMPDLSNLNNGDIAMQVDFRQIYATILSNWLNTNPDKILGKQFKTLNVFV